MLTIRLRVFSDLAASLIIFVGLFLLGGCQPPSGPASPSNVNANAPSATPTPSPSPATKAQANTPVTLPLLDALLTEDDFVNEAKTSVQLTDEQIQKLRDAARDAVLNLNQEDSSDESRSTRTSVEKARAKVFEIVGREKGEKFIAFVQQRWADQGAELADQEPNSVPVDTRIVVNAPEYRMDIFTDGKLTKSYKVGIGYPEFPLPTGLRKAEKIIFNPTWTPPDETWVKGKIEAGKKIEAGSKLNPLGPIKIPIGLPSLIHGGKNPARLGTFASHGCVGLTDAQVEDFAIQLSSLAEQPLTMDDIKGYAKNKTETKEIKLGTPIPVELRYETIVVEDGKLKIFRDVYERGTNTEENLSRVLDSYGVSLNDLDPVLRQKILAGLASMAVDAHGDPIEPNASPQTDDANKAANKGDGKVTRTIKGKKEVVFEIAELSGKGYPEPVGLSPAR